MRAATFVGPVDSVNIGRNSIANPLVRMFTTRVAAGLSELLAVHVIGQGP